ncbi:hypothetical protein FGG78_20990 [Thioclava sp. BHET1]|nr:hypothetical protein FGG78_20990 [Thioclava sp. BHET1]
MCIRDRITIAGGYDNPPELLLDSVAINTQALTIFGRPIPIAMAVQGILSGGQDGTLYRVAITCKTNNPSKILTLKALVPVSAQ